MKYRRQQLSEQSLGFTKSAAQMAVRWTFALLAMVIANVALPSNARAARSPLLDAARSSSGSSPSEPQANSGQSGSPDLAHAERLIEAGQLQQAQTSVRSYLAQHPDSADAHYLLGYILFREIQQNASAEGAAQGSQNNELGENLAKLAKSNAQASLGEYTAGARQRKPSASDLKIVAFDYVILEDYVDADKWLTRALQGNPEDSEAWYYLGRAKYNENRFDEAVHAFEQCLTRDPGNVKAEDNLGLSLEGLGKIEEATAAYRKAIALQSNAPYGQLFAGPFEDLGSLLLDQNNPEDAVEYLTRAAEISPREARVHEKLGKAYAELKQLENAQRELQAAVKLSPKNPRLHFMLGQVYRKQGLLEKAKAELALSAALNSTHSNH